MSFQENLKEIGFYIFEIVVCYIVVHLIVYFFVQPVRFEGNSMYPNYSDDSLGVYFKFNTDKNDIKRFDVVVLNCEEIDALILKRVIGLPGDTIKIKNDQLYINDELIVQDFLNDEYVEKYKSENQCNFTDDIEEITLKEDEYYVLGDNRPYSFDSRYFGVFHYNDIKSTNGFIFYPFSNIGTFN